MDLNNLLGYTELGNTVYHVCPRHGKSFAGNKCPLCRADEMKRVHPSPDARCSVCGELIKECQNKGKK